MTTSVRRLSPDRFMAHRGPLPVPLTFRLPVTAPVSVLGRLLEPELVRELVDEDMLELVRVS